MLQLNAIGNLTRDGVMGASSSTDVLNFAVAVNDRRTKETTYVDCAFGVQEQKPYSNTLKEVKRYLCKAKQV